MKHGILTIVAPIQQNREAEVRERIRNLQNSGLATGPLIGLHFASVAVLGPYPEAPDDFTPHLLFEANFDGTREDFVADLIAYGGDWLDTVFQHCEGYPSQGTRIPQVVNNYLFRHDRGTDCSYFAYPFRSVEQIHHESRLRSAVTAIERALRSDWLPPPRARSMVSEIRYQITSVPDLRGALTLPERPFITTYGPQIGDWVLRSLVALLFVGAVGYGARSQALRMAEGQNFAMVGVLISFSLMATLLAVWRPRWKKRARLALIAAAVAYLATESEQVQHAIDVVFNILGELSRLLFQAFLLLLAVVAAWLVVVQLHEWFGDPPPEVPSWDRDRERQLRLQEHRAAQNHMVGLNRIKGGLFRPITLRVVLWTIHGIKHFQKSGLLSGISTIHFARWVIIDRGRQLLFISHYDGDWDNYLGDFVEQASQGLTAIWSNCVGFPRAWFLFFGGAKDQRAFKAYARRSQHETLWVYRAYPQLTVTDIQNHTAIREALGSSLDAEGLDALLQRL